MKKIIALLFFGISLITYSQKDNSKLNTNSSTPFFVGLASGISSPSSNFSNDAYAKNGNYFELAGAYYFSKFGIGVSIGQISSPTNENFSSSINAVDIPTTNTTQDWKQFYYGIGPEYKAMFGNFSATFSTKIGLQSVKSINLESNYTNGETPIAILKIKSDKTSSLSYFSTDLRFGYNISSNFNLYATVNYMSALSNGITISKSKITDSNQNGIIDAEDLKFATGSATIDYETSTQNIKPQTTNFGIGLSYSFGSKKGYDYYKAKADNNVKRKRPGRTKYANITLKRSQAKDDGVNNGTRAINHDASRSNNTNSIAAPESKGDGNGENNGTKAINHDASRNNNTNSIAAPESKGDGDDSTARRGKRKAKKECLKNGGSFWENGDGSYHCMMPLSTAKAGENTNNELFRSKKRKCFKAGGKWVTNSYGSFCWNPSATSKVYGPGDAHYGHITDKIDKKKKSKVEVSVILTNRSIEEPIRMGGSGGWLNTITFSSVDNDCDSDTSPVKRMNKAELIDAMAKDANLSKADAKRALETLTSNLSKSLKKGNSVQLIGFGNSISARAARTGRNPQTGTTIKIASKKGYDYYKAKADNVKRINNSQNPQGNGGKTQRNKAELIDAMAKDANLSKADAGKALNTFMATILKELNNGNCVKLIVPVAINKGIREGEKTIGAGTNTKRKRPGRTTYNNITLERSQAKGDGNGENNGTKAINHDASRSNNTNSIVDSKGDGDDSTARRGKRKAKKECLKNGGSFWENGNGSYHCMMPLSTAKIGENTNNELFRSKKRKCFKAGGQWVTNSHGSFCWNPKKQTARVEVRGWNPKEKSTSRKGYDYYKANANNVKRKRPGRTTYSNITLERSQAKGDGDGENNGTKAINHDASRSNNTNSIVADSKGNGNGKVLQGYTKESTMIFVRVDETSLRKSNTKIPKDKFTQENNKRMSKKSLRNRKRLGDKRYRERTKPRSLRSADKRYRERTKARTLRSTDKRYRERTKARTLRSADKRYRERTKARTLRSTDKRYRERTKARTLRSADKRYRERTKARTLRSADKRYRKKIRRYRMKNNKNTIQNDKPVKMTTEGNNKVNPSTNLDARFLKAQNYQTIHIAKSKFQLTAPLIISKDQTELINYNWTIKNNKQNKVETFTGKTINYNFDVSGTYEIEIIPVVNNKNLNSYHLNIICN